MTSTTFFIIFIPILAIILLAVNLVLAPHNPYQEKDSVFECGFHSFLGQNRTQFSVSFFIFGLLFLLFDLEILLVYPYSVSSYTNDIYGLVVMMVFFVLLTLGFIFELGKNALTIESRQTSVKEGELSIPYAFSSRLASFISTHSFTSSIFYPERLAFFSKLEKASALGGIMLGKIKEMYTILANSTSTDLQGYPKFTFFNE
jgi:NADH-ubiquinone oxidoreductase chain 3